MCITLVVFISVYVYMWYMGRMQIVLSDEIEEKLRKVVPTRKGEISKAVEKAIAEWLKKEK